MGSLLIITINWCCGANGKAAGCNSHGGLLGAGETEMGVENPVGLQGKKTRKSVYTLLFCRARSHSWVYMSDSDFLFLLQQGSETV